jgi:hypothetical protein
MDDLVTALFGQPLRHDVFSADALAVSNERMNHTKEGAAEARYVNL